MLLAKKSLSMAALPPLLLRFHSMLSIRKLIPIPITRVKEAIVAYIMAWFPSIVGRSSITLNVNNSQLVVAVLLFPDNGPSWEKSIFKTSNEIKMFKRKLEFYWYATEESLELCFSLNVLTYNMWTRKILI